MLDRIRRREVSPFGGIVGIQDEMNKLFDTFFEGDLSPSGVGFVPTVDISETKKDIRVRADLPGMTEKDIDVSVSGNVLTIKGKKEEEKEESGEDFYRKERVSGSFLRQIQVPTNTKTDGIHAKFKNGVLTVSLPKSTESVEKAVKVEVG